RERFGPGVLSMSITRVLPPPPAAPPPGPPDASRWDSLGRGPLLLETTLPGVFAAGDVRSGSVKRVASAAGEGAMAIRFVHEHREMTGNLVRPAGPQALKGVARGVPTSP
ncbi:hypothetical protein ACFVG7_22470, partial [Streptomyces sp. NPDC127112]